MRAVWLFAIAGVIGCSDKAPPPEPGIEATVVEVKQIAAAEPPPKPVPVVAEPPPKAVETPKPPVVRATPTKQPKKAPPPQVKTEPAGSAQPTTPPPADPNKPTLEQNPYVYK